MPGRTCLLLCSILAFTLFSRGADLCAVCGEAIRDDVLYRIKDKVTEEKTNLCSVCSQIKDDCFVCGLPVKKDFTKLPDARFLCSRDAKTAVLDPAEQKRICTEVLDTIDRQFSRFIRFPQDVDLEVVDRVTLLRFKVPGNDYECPNILGYFTSVTNAHKIEYQVRVMSALTEGESRQVAAHEFTHMWVRHNVAPGRQKSLRGDAEEGFCELVSYLLMDALQEDAQKKRILHNAYTRGQIQLFVEANNQFGFNDVVDWVKYGTSTKLIPGELDKIRDVRPPSLKTTSPGASTSPAAYPATAAPEHLVLNGLLGPKNQRFALINNRAFTTGESGKVRLGGTNITIECLQILEDSVLIRTPGGQGRQQLFLKDAE